MRVHSSPASAAEHPRADARTLAAALLLFAALLVFVTSCGNEDLIFPGNIPATATPEFTATPEPV